MDDLQRALERVPDKSYFRIGEVARITGIKPYVLRYWETEFKDLAPPKSRSQQRMYRRRDIERILLVKQLLYKERFTIEGARQRLAELGRDERNEGRSAAPLDTKAALARIRGELIDLRDLLGRT